MVSRIHIIIVWLQKHEDRTGGAEERNNDVRD